MKWVRCVTIIIAAISFAIPSLASSLSLMPVQVEYYKNNRYTFYDSVIRDIKLFKYQQPLSVYIPIQIPAGSKVKNANLTAASNDSRFSNKTVYVSFKNTFGQFDDGRDVYNLSKTATATWNIQRVNNTNQVTASGNLASMINNILTRTGKFSGNLLLLICPTQSCEAEGSGDEIEIEDLRLSIEFDASGAPDSSPGDGDSISSSDISILHSTSSNRSSATQLNNKNLSADDMHYIFVPTKDGIDSVEFYINGRVYKSEYQAPFDMSGTAGDNTALPLILSDLYSSGDLIDGKNFVHVIVNGDDSLNKESYFYYEHTNDYKPLKIVSQPQTSYSLTEGDSLSLKIQLTDGDGYYSYKWFKNGSLINSQNTSNKTHTHIISKASIGDNGAWFQCSADDGITYLECQPTQIQVQQVSSSGQAYLSWRAPTTRVNGDVFMIDEIDHYLIKYWRDGSSEVKTISIYDALKTDHVIQNLSQGKWFFMIKVIDKDGLSSDFSSSVSKSFN